jgi:hypothetical protein
MKMTNPAMVPAIRAAIQANELGSVSPYCLSYAKLASSGASFGIFQGDTHVNATARATLTNVLQAAGADAPTIQRIMAAVSQACPNGCPLSPADAALTDAALSSAAGRALVDAMDGKLLAVVEAELDSSVAAAANGNLTIAPVALLYIALWVNMTGAPNTLNQWLDGVTELGLPPPAGPIVGQSDIETYLQATTYFQLHPRSFLHMQQSVQAGVPLLPNA